MKINSENLNQINDLTQHTVANLHTRLSTLSGMLKDISEKLSESNSAAKAYAIVQTALMLERINWEVMNEVTQLMIEVDACNIFPTINETRVQRSVIVEATDLANDIFADMPIGYRIVEPQDGCNGKENASENLIPSEVVITGSIVLMRKIITKNHDLMAICDILHEDKTSTEISILPKTFARYRDILETIKQTDVIRAFVCEFDGKSNILKEIKFTDALQYLDAQKSETEKPQFKPGQRVILTKTILDTTTDVHPVHHYAGDEGVVVESCGQPGFKSDRYGDIISIGRYVDGEFRQVLDFCVPDPVETPPDYSAPKDCEYCLCDEACIYKTEFNQSPTGYGWLCDYCNQYLSPAPPETGSES